MYTFHYTVLRPAVIRIPCLVWICGYVYNAKTTKNVHEVVYPTYLCPVMHHGRYRLSIEHLTNLPEGLEVFVYSIGL